jgi:hypothetical protein
MEIVNNAFVNQTAAYYNSGGLIVGTQRIPYYNPQEYWQQANIETTLAIKTTNIVETIKGENFIDKALYIGRIPEHLGHFIMEGLPRLSEVLNFDIPIIGYTTKGFLPSGFETLPKEDIKWIFSRFKNKFIEISETDTFMVNTLYVPQLPIKMCNNCEEPWRLSKLIKFLKDEAIKETGIVNCEDVLYLTRFDETMEDINTTMESLNESSFEVHNPRSSLATQISKVSLAIKLYGIMGSNTHLSIFGRKEADTYWFPRRNIERVRNQLICDLTKTYNLY